jgi:hypothetical protein
MTWQGDCLLRVSDADDGFEMYQRMIYLGAREEFVIPAGMPTDLASVPAPMTWLISRYGGGVTRCAILHDALCRGLATDITGRPVTVSRRDADGLFRRALVDVGASPLRADLMWAAVRLESRMSDATPAEQREIIRLAPKAAVLLAPSLPVLWWQRGFARLEERSRRIA